jgi:methylenetetrahydrofolate reductase (NADPH)
VATDICSDLMDHGIDQFHFYTLNRPYLTRDVCLALGIVPDTKLALVA